jgi:cellulose synthase/poly-beta-1,6-N-acetylglucosamine synthase-like glycosyltransferase
MSLASFAGLAGVGAWGWLMTMRGHFWRVDPLRQAAMPDCWPGVVAVIPARDEAEVIGDAVESLLSQNYPGTLSVVVVDDHSSDGTADTARARAEAIGAAARLTVVSAPDLPPGWTGKMWAQSHGIAPRAGSIPTPNCCC